MNVRTIIGLTALASFLVFPPTITWAEGRELLLAAYSVPKEVYEKRIIPAFVQQWKQKTGETIQIRSSFAASGAQARAVVGGLEADIAALSLESDLQQLVKAGFVTYDWKQGAQKGIVTTSVVALGVRKGNPKAIQGWEDLTKPGLSQSENLRRRDVGCDCDLRGGTQSGETEGSRRLCGGSARH
jgi:sulfate transport system substrate-binding protein